MPLASSVLTVAFANGKIHPIKKTPNIGPEVAPVKLKEACKTWPPILSATKDTIMAAAPYSITAKCGKFEEKTCGNGNLISYETRTE